MDKTTRAQEGSDMRGWWVPGARPAEPVNRAIGDALRRVARPFAVVSLSEGMAVGEGGTISIGPESPPGADAVPLIAHIPELHPEALGDPDFRRLFGLRYAYIAGAMANGITSVEMVEAMAKAGMMGFFGAAGLPLDKIENAIENLKRRLGSLPFGFNLIHSPADPELESATVQLYHRKGIHQVSAAAFMDLTLPLVYYRVKGIHRDGSGRIMCPNRIVAKVSRIEVARKFLSPPPEKLLSQLVQRRLVNETEASLASMMPLADALTAEADSGGHTDNRPALSLLPTMIALRNSVSAAHGYRQTPSVGLGGGISTPESAAAAFAMGASYVLTGSINQACKESGTSEAVRQMLAEADPADITMAPAADMFEMGVKVQVLKRGTLFPLRAGKLYELYGTYDDLNALPPTQRQILERNYFRCTIEEEWDSTRDFFSLRDPKQVERAEADPKHKMALLFRSYLGKASAWAISGHPDRKIDYQIWCGPAMGAFNQWAKGSFLEDPSHRDVVTLAMNILLGASVSTRASWLRTQEVPLSPEAAALKPMRLPQIQALLENR